MSTTQITVRLPDDVVHYLDQLVSDGDAKSRAAAVTRALRREHRRQQSMRDAELYATRGEDPEAAGLAEWQLATISTAHLD